MAQNHNQPAWNKQLGKLVRKSLKSDRKIRVEKVAEQAAHFLEQNNTHEAYQYLQGWYKPTNNKATNPTDKDMERIQQEYKKLYAAVEPTEAPIQTHITYDIINLEPQEEEIIRALKKMRLRKAPGPSGITIIMIRGWYSKAHESTETCEESLIIWKKIVELIQHMFTKAEIPVSFSYGEYYSADP
jgi:hypothetical protein